MNRILAIIRLFEEDDLIMDEWLLNPLNQAFMELADSELPRK